jgi:hypothetical protein
MADDIGALIKSHLEICRTRDGSDSDLGTSSPYFFV